jgi:hypothetical protein
MLAVKGRSTWLSAAGPDRWSELLRQAAHIESTKEAVWLDR